MENNCEKCKCLSCSYYSCGHCKDCQELEEDKVVKNCQWYENKTN